MTHSPIRVGFIVATFNSESYILRLLNSISLLSADNVEIYVHIQDNLSSDRTVSLVHDLMPSFPHHLDVTSVCDSGIYDAWNIALRRTVCDWYVFIGSDDIVLPNFSRLISIAADVDCNLFNLITSRMFVVSSCVNYKTVGLPFSIEVLKRQMPLANCSCLYHSSLFDSKSFDSSYRIAGDYEFLCRSRHNILSMHLPLVTSYMDSGGVSSTHLKRTYLESSRVIHTYFGLKHLIIYTLRFWCSIFARFVK